MSEPYEEAFAGERVLRLPPGPRHELICTRLHGVVKASAAQFTGIQQLAPRTPVELTQGTRLCPDLALITAATHKLWLAAEIISSEDHHNDTVRKKELYETNKIPRLWMIDPRYGNVEVYHATVHGLALKNILAGREVLRETLLPTFALGIADLFASETAP